VTSRSEKDIKMWETWKQTPTPDSLGVLITQMKPVIYKATQINQGALSPAVIEAEAKLQALKAFKTYDPAKNVKLSTHVTNYMQKVNRINYQYQDIYSVPESRRIKFTTFNNAKERLREELGRDPTAEELANDLKWSRSEVQRFFSEQRYELSDSQPHHSDLGMHDTRDKTMLSYIYNDLTPQQKLLLEHTTGYGGKKILDNSGLTKKLGMTQSQLSYSKRQLAGIIKEKMGITI